jgi:hypothetical protein
MAAAQNGLQQANSLVRSIYHQITCKDAPVNNSSGVRFLLPEMGTKIPREEGKKAYADGNDNLSTTASEHSNTSSVSCTRKPNMILPPRPPNSKPVLLETSVDCDEPGAVLTGTVSLANLCRRTEESVSGLSSREDGVSSFPSLPLNMDEDEADIQQPQWLSRQQQDTQFQESDGNAEEPTPKRSNGSLHDLTLHQQFDNATDLFHDTEEDFVYPFSGFNEHENVGDYSQHNQRLSHNGSSPQCEVREQSTHIESTPNQASDTSHQKPRLQMFASEYARILSSCKHNSVGNTRMRRTANMGNMMNSRLKARLTRGDHGETVGIPTLEECSNSVASAAITDIIVTSGSEPPPRGYYRVFPLEGPEKNIAGTIKKRQKRMYLNAKKEVNWDRAVQRPCVTAICVIYPDRNEFVPPGFSVVRQYCPQNGTSQMTRGKEDSSEFGSSSSSSQPANINPSSSGERVYLCYRRSREGNPITGMLCLKPTRGDLIPEGYTVLERTPRNFVADMTAKTCEHPMFLAYRQRLENLECLRPLPLVLAVLNSRPGEGGRRELKAYYSTGGTVVTSDVGQLVSHIMFPRLFCVPS